MLHDLDGFYSDSPIDSADLDAFERDHFALRMASAIDRMGAQSRSSVAALVGPWGSGKSSVLNLLDRKLKDREQTWMVRRFNPWLFSDIDSLLINFFDEIAGAIPDSQAGRRLRKQIGGYASKIAPLGKFGALAGKDLESAIRAAGELISGKQSVNDQREELRVELGKLDRRVLIVMDDVDRLQPEELLLVLKLIRLIGDLPNLYYLLAYDERTLLDVIMGTPIGNNNQARAAQYIDKIVQLRFDLPPLTDSQEEKIFSDGIGKIVQSSQQLMPETEFTRLREFFEGQMRDTLRVPRRLNTYFAQLSTFVDESLATEMNLADFAILTYLRTFQGTLYSRLPYWKSELLGYGKSSLISWTNDKDGLAKRRQMWEARFKEASIKEPEHQATFDMLGHVFPVFREFQEGIHSGGVDPERATQNRNVSTVEYFDRYFQFSVPADDIPDVVVAGALATLTEDAQPSDEYTRFVARMHEEPTLALTKVRAFTRVRTVSNPVPLLDLLAQNYEGFGENARQFAIRSPQDLCRYITVEVLDQIPAEKRQSTIDYVAEKLDLDYSLDVAYTAKRSMKVSWADTLVERLSSRFKKHIETAYINLTDVSYEDFSPFKTWALIEEKGVARTIGETKIAEGKWDLESYLGKITGSTYMLGVSNPKPRLSELDPEWLNLFIGTKFAITRLEDRLDSVSTEHVSAHQIAEPTDQQRVEYALYILREIRDAQTDGTASESSDPD